MNDIFLILLNSKNQLNQQERNIPCLRVGILRKSRQFVLRVRQAVEPAGLISILLAWN
jgi:hypothetical protein